MIFSRLVFHGLPPLDMPQLDKQKRKLRCSFRKVQAVLDGVATLKVRKGTFDALNKGSGALGKVRWSRRPVGGAPWRTVWKVALQKLHCNIRFSAVRKSFEDPILTPTPNPRIPY